MFLNESNVKAAVGTLFQPVTLNDPMIKRIMDYIVKETGKPRKELEDHMQEEIQRANDLAVRSHLLYSTAASMAAEGALFRMFGLPEEALKIEKLAIMAGEHFDVSQYMHTPKGAPQFDPVTFSKLIRRVKVENPSIFPLRNPFNKKPIASPRIIIVPSKDKTDWEFNDVDTAAATGRGEFIFNRHFIQQAMNYAYVRGKKPKSAKYASNGGDFPDEYAMVEFLILHEFFHYTHGDFHYQKVLKDGEGKGANPKIINWVGDFRSNYDLVKAGHEPIPVGLYNDLVNYDRNATYKEMYERVRRELQRLNKLPKAGDVVKTKSGDYKTVVKISTDGKKVTCRPATQDEINHATAAAAKAAAKTTKKP